MRDILYEGALDAFNGCEVMVTRKQVELGEWLIYFPLLKKCDMFSRKEIA